MHSCGAFTEGERWRVRRQTERAAQAQQLQLKEGIGLGLARRPAEPVDQAYVACVEASVYTDCTACTGSGPCTAEAL